MCHFTTSMKEIISVTPHQYIKKERTICFLLLFSLFESYFSFRHIPSLSPIASPLRSSLSHLILCFFDAFFSETNFSVSWKLFVSSVTSLLRWRSSWTITVLCPGSSWIPEVSSFFTFSCPILWTFSRIPVSPSSCTPSRVELQPSLSILLAATWRRWPLEAEMWVKCWGFMVSWAYDAADKPRTERGWITGLVMTGDSKFWVWLFDRLWCWGWRCFGDVRL